MHSELNKLSEYIKVYLKNTTSYTFLACFIQNLQYPLKQIEINFSMAFEQIDK